MPNVDHTLPINRRSVRDALDRATSQLVRADWQFRIPGPHQRDHWQRSLKHLDMAEVAIHDALAILQMLYLGLYGPRED